MISLTTEVQVDVLVEEVVEGMSTLRKRPTFTGSMRLQQSTNSNAHATPILPLGTFRLTYVLTRLQPCLLASTFREVRTAFYMVTLFVLVHPD